MEADTRSQSMGMGSTGFLLAKACDSTAEGAEQSVHMARASNISTLKDSCKQFDPVDWGLAGMRYFCETSTTTRPNIWAEIAMNLSTASDETKMTWCKGDLTTATGATEIDITYNPYVPLCKSAPVIAIADYDYNIVAIAPNARLCKIVSANNRNASNLYTVRECDKDGNYITGSVNITNVPNILEYSYGPALETGDTPTTLFADSNGDPYIARDTEPHICKIVAANARDTSNLYTVRLCDSDGDYLPDSTNISNVPNIGEPQDIGLVASGALLALFTTIEGVAIYEPPKLFRARIMADEGGDYYTVKPANGSTGYHSWAVNLTKFKASMFMFYQAALAFEIAETHLNSIGDALGVADDNFDRITTSIEPYGQVALPWDDFVPAPNGDSGYFLPQVGDYCWCMVTAEDIPSGAKSSRKIVLYTGTNWSSLGSWT